MDNRTKTEDSIRNCYSTWGETYHDEYYGKDAPYPPIHLDLEKKILKKNIHKNILDAGFDIENPHDWRSYLWFLHS